MLTATSERTAKLFRTDWLQTEYTPDAFGVLLCGTFTHIYAIGAGEKSLVPNTAPFREYIETALTEIKYLLAANNCNPSTADLSCGKLDLVLTCASQESRNYNFGKELKKHNHLDPTTITNTTEGFSAINSLKSSNLIIPAGCDVLNKIIERVKDATK
ncbi:hypothetical protein IJ096_00505 [Candidatus Saccharibacteria bacterium]|nr:hypothetical protein [Candidatus Saccharibacteria bacterium]